MNKSFTTFLAALWPFSKRGQSAALVRQPPRRNLVKTYRPQDILGDKAKGKPQNTKYTTADAVDGGLLASVWVWRCCKVIADNVASVPWVVKQLQPDGSWKAQPLSPLQKLIDQPNKLWSRNRFFQESAYSMLLAGEAFQSKIRSRALGRSKTVYETDNTGAPKRDEQGNKIFVGIPHELWVLPPDKIKPIPGGSNRPLVSGYEAKLATKPKPTTTPASEIMQPMFVNIADPYHGIAPLTAARRDIDTDVAAADWQKTTFDNRAVPDGVFVVKDYVEQDGDVEDDGETGWTKTEAKLRAAYFGAQNARAPMFLGQDIDWKQMAQTALDMDFQGGRKSTRENICAAFGVPIILAGSTEGATYANFSASELWLWKSNIIPMLDIFRDKFNTQLCPEYGPGWRLDYDLANVAALMSLYAERWAVATLMLAAGVPMKIVNDRLQLGVEPYDGWAVGRIPATLVDVSNDVTGPGL